MPPTFVKSEQDTDSFPLSLATIEDLRQHIRAEFEQHTSTEKGDKFAQFVQKLVPQTDAGHDFERPVINPKRANDGGVDLTAQGRDGRSVLYIQAKLTIDRAETIDNVVSKFQDYFTNSHVRSGNSAQAVLDLDSRVVHFMVVTLSPLENIIEKYKNKNFGSKKFFDECDEEGRISFIHGQQVLSTLRAAYRKSHQIPADLTINLVTEPIKVNNVYLGAVSGQELQRLYSEFGDALFFENIRDFLGLPKERAGRSTPNQEIIKTIRDTPDKMLQRNNGIVVKAEAVVQDSLPERLILKKGSIVNGCQTTMCLADYAKADCFVPIKIVQTDDSWDIAKAANYQNSVEAIDLDLARYLRPQLVKKAAALSGIQLEDGAESVLQILDQIYSRRVAYDETRLLYIGLFSRSPNNLFAGNYTELVGELLKRFESDAAYEEQTFGTLFSLQSASQDGLALAEKRLSHPSYVSKFKRLYNEDTPSYRCFISILALCGAVDINIADRKSDIDVEYSRMKGFFDKAQLLLQNQRPIFLRYYILAVKTWMQEVLPVDSDETAVGRDMSSLSKRANFTNMFTKLNMDADADETLQEMKQSPETTQ